MTQSLSCIKAAKSHNFNRIYVNIMSLGNNIKQHKRVQKRALGADWSAQLRQWARTIKAFPVIAVIEPNMFPAPIKMKMANGPGGLGRGGGGFRTFWVGMCR